MKGYVKDSGVGTTASSQHYFDGGKYTRSVEELSLSKALRLSSIQRMSIQSLAVWNS